MRYYILLAAICIAMVYVTAVNMPGTGSETSFFAAAKENPIVPVADAYIEPTQDRATAKTPNGLDMITEKIKNFREEKQDIIIKAQAQDGAEFYFDVTISPNMTWGYGKVGNFIVVPQKDAFVTQATSYYSNGDELVIILDGNTSEVYTYVGSKGSPTLVITDKDTFWEYDIRNGLVKIRSSDTNVSTIIMFWGGNVRGTSFIEDTRKEENMRYGMVELSDHITELQADLENERSNLANLSASLDSANAELEKARLNKIQTEKAVDELRQSVEKGDDIITTSVLLSPVQTAVGVVITLILLVLAADALLFRPRKKV